MSDLKDPRAFFAAERTLPAWNRTSLSLFAFGFVVERAGMFMQAISSDALRADQLVMSFWLGIAFIALGSVTSAYSAKQYAIVLRTLTPAEIPPAYAAKWGLIVNTVVALLGPLLVVTLLFWRMHGR